MYHEDVPTCEDPGLKVSLVPALLVTGLPSKLEGEALAGIAMSSKCSEQGLRCLDDYSYCSKVGGDGCQVPMMNSDAGETIG